MELCDVTKDNEEALMSATRALFTLKRASARVDASVTWARVSANVLSRSKNPAIAAEARRLQQGLYDLNRPYASKTAEPAQPSEIFWLSFSRA